MPRSFSLVVNMCQEPIFSQMALNVKLDYQTLSYMMEEIQARFEPRRNLELSSIFDFNRKLWYSYKLFLAISCPLEMIGIENIERWSWDVQM